ncbi:MAG TPA: hypothetical protein VK176_08860 [Phycisphaerales bacterium]|nr:hypothetical protein [Phycisphaerales bacterium]
MKHVSGTPSGPVTGGPQGSAAGRLAAGGLSMLVALALVVNLTCRAVGPSIASLRESTSERTPLKQLSLAIHRVVRRLLKREVRGSTSATERFRERYGRRLRGDVGSGQVHAVLAAARVHIHSVALPPPACA